VLRTRRWTGSSASAPGSFAWLNSRAPHPRPWQHSPRPRWRARPPDISSPITKNPQSPPSYRTSFAEAPAPGAWRRTPPSRRATSRHSAQARPADGRARSSPSRPRCADLALSHGATARRSAQMICSRSGAFRVPRECARSADLCSGQAGSSVRTLAPAARPATALLSAVAASASGSVAATRSESCPWASVATSAASRGPSART
jgi:hypothetical protein